MRSAARVRSCTPSSSPTSQQRSPCNRCVDTASMLLCSTATSWCRPMPWGSASTYNPAPDRSPSSRSAVALTSIACDRSTGRTSATSSTPSNLLVAELSSDVPLLAFAGAPFTVGSYLIEGRPSKDYRYTKSMMHTDPVLFGDVMERLATQRGHLHRRATPARRSGFQLFDSWAGSLEPSRL